MNDSRTRIRELWRDSPARHCPNSCFCVLPEHCRSLVPTEAEAEKQRRLSDGLVERHVQKDGYVAVTYVDSDELNQ